MESNTSPPLLLLSPTNHGPVVSVFTFVCLTTAVIFAIVKLVSSIYFKQRGSNVDIPIWISTGAGLAQSIIIQFAVDSGMGKHRDTLSDASLDRYHKMVYIADILILVVLAFSKLSTALLVLNISPNKRIRAACLFTMGLIAVWSLMAILADALQCGLPNPWRCTGKAPIQYVIGIFNIVTDLSLVALPVYLLIDVQMALGKRLRIAAAFSTRLAYGIPSKHFYASSLMLASVPATTIAELFYLSKYIDTADYTWNVVNVAICKQFMMNTSIIAACMPTLYHVLSGFSVGLTDLRLTENLELSTGQRTYPKQSLNQSKASSKHWRSNSLSRNMNHIFRGADESEAYGQDTQIRYSRRGSESTESTRHLTRAETPGEVMKTVDISVSVEARGND